ncbi:MAG: HAD-IA family hydrolase [Candidatus Acidiferrales bacterium]
MAESTTPDTQALIFDIGRVILRVNVGRALGALSGGSGLNAEQVWSAIQTDPRWRDWQEGRVTPHDWHEHLARRFRLALGFGEFCAVWNSSLERQMILDEELFAGLAARYRLGLLSNTDPIHVAHLEANFSFVRHFPVRVFSCIAGVSKPDAGIYRRAIHGTGVPPDKILYIDDVQEYVTAAEQAGMQGLLFRNPKQLLSEFHQRGILQP